jgi:hypothetical protein
LISGFSAKAEYKFKETAKTNVNVNRFIIVANAKLNYPEQAHKL